VLCACITSTALYVSLRDSVTPPASLHGCTDHSGVTLATSPQAHPHITRVLSLTPVRHSTQDPRSHAPTSNITDLVVVVLLLSSVWYDSGHFRAARAAVSEPWPRPVLPTPKPGEACRVHSTATTSPVTRRIGEALRRAAVPVNPLWHVHACLFLVVTLELRGQGGLHGCATAKSRTLGAQQCVECRCSHILSARQLRNVAVRI
jgi:hypothetical protein